MSIGLKTMVLGFAIYGMATVAHASLFVEDFDGETAGEDLNNLEQFNRAGGTQTRVSSRTWAATWYCG